MSIIQHLKSILDLFGGIWKLIYVVTVPGALLATILMYYKEIPAKLTQLNAHIDAIAAQLHALPIGVVMNRVNVIFPATELSQMLLGWFILYGICLVIRVVRSLLPTIGG